MQVGEGDREEHDHHRSRFINRAKMNESKQPIMASSWQSRGKGWGGESTQCVDETTPTPAYLFQYSAATRSSLSRKDGGIGPGRYGD
jgi:hypothetical protein